MLFVLVLSDSVILLPPGNANYSNNGSSISSRRPRPYLKQPAEKFWQHSPNINFNTFHQYYPATIVHRSRHTRETLSNSVHYSVLSFLRNNDNQIRHGKLYDVNQVKHTPWGNKEDQKQQKRLNNNNKGTASNSNFLLHEFLLPHVKRKHRHLIPLGNRHNLVPANNNPPILNSFNIRPSINNAMMRPSPLLVPMGDLPRTTGTYEEAGQLQKSPIALVVILLAFAFALLWVMAMKVLWCNNTNKKDCAHHKVRNEDLPSSTKHYAGV